MNVEIHGRIAPNAVHIEEIIICQCFTSSDAFQLSILNLVADDFYNEKHRIIFNSMQRLWINSITPDITTVISDLEQNSELDKIGGIQSILDLSSKMTGFTNIDFHVKRIKDLSLKREGIKLAYEILKDSYDEVVNGFDMLSDVQFKFETIYKNSMPKYAETWGDTLKKVHKEIITSNGNTGLKTGYDSLDTRTGGFLPSELIILAAGPGEGKTTYAINIAKYISENIGGVLFFSLEMSKEELALKYFSYETGESIKDIRFNRVDLSSALTNEKLMNGNLFVFDKNIDSVQDIVSIAKAERKRKDIKLVIVDYIQLVPAGSAKKFGTREQEISHISRSLKKLGQDTGLPIMALSQVSRQKGRKTYNLSDLRESGAIEQDANIVVFVWRPSAHNDIDYEDRNGFEHLNLDIDDAFIKIEKNRLGILDEWKVTFDGKGSKFKDNNEFSQKSNIETNENLPF